ncbi:aminotransferase class III-fold pyridoxal phosphate-dependent enzyme [Chitinophaga vietnamensis]|uniref:aminotransferase class III-fold pyridoxal phosphate-dependent enzyme n=1 Tax=Chitinophaga vietnamensis TaxID=2593957 RepID=UPI001177978A|nr:aminotransferase class III-fold pyridoxal phosphate-dependent enzyme [Chitinophaga vietnamensis]
MITRDERIAELSPLQKAYLKIEEYKAKLNKLEDKSRHYSDVAVIGMALRFPQADTPAAYWENLVNGRDHIRPFPEQRAADVTDYLRASGKPAVTFREAAYLDEIDHFDHRFFKFKQKEAAQMHPLQRLLLQVSWQAMEDGGYLDNSDEQCRTGVYLGISGDITYSQYLDMIAASDPQLGPLALTGNNNAISSSRVSYFLDLKGPAITIDTACSSSLVAIHQACKALMNGDCEMALAGGGRVYLVPEKGRYEVGFESPAGRTKAFDNAADGAGVGEGVAVVLLKPLDKAIADGDRIHAVIKGSAINQDGTSAGITAPNLAAQEAVLKSAWQAAGITPDTITYIETHGTGTALGDPIEFQALQEAFGTQAPAGQCALGAVKSNIGHLFEAAGIAGLIKCVLALQHRQLPPLINYHTPNREIKLDASPFYINTTNVDWNPPGLRRCGVSSFGISGTNAHVVLEEYTPALPHTNGAAVAPQLFALSAASREDLLVLAAAYVAWLGAKTDADLESVCYSTNTGRAHYPWRLAVVVDSVAQLQEALRKPEAILQEAASRSRINGYTNIQELAALYMEGGMIKWSLLYNGKKIQKIKLPPYPLNPVRCWVTYDPSKTAVTAALAPAAAITPTYTRESVIAALRIMIAKDTDLRPEDIQEDADFFQLGLDSLIIMQLIQGIRKEWQLQLEMSQFYEKLNTLRLLTDHLLANANITTTAPVQAAPVAANTVAAKPAQINYYVPYKEVQKKSDHNLTPQQQQHLQQLAARVNQATAKSKASTQQYRSVLANNRNVAGFRPELKEITYQIIAESGNGANITDLDGNRYVDLTMGFGVNLLGYNPEFIKAALMAELQKGFPVGPMVETAGKVATLMHEMTGVERVAFYNSGSEAVMVALRLARATTGRNKVVLFKGSYHGTFDGVLALASALDPASSIPLAPGIADNYVSNVTVLDYATPASLEFIRAHAHELAAVLVEPVQSRRPDIQPRDFLHAIREITTAAGAAMIMDEVITGFRIHQGGAQAWFGIKADLVTYGKITGGGMPIGIVGGTAKFMDAVDGGMWQFGDQSYPDKPTTFVAGTFNQHPLAMQASLQMLTYLKQQGPALQENLNARTAALAERLNKYFAEKRVPVSVVHFGSLFRFVLKGNWELFYQHLLANGVYVWEGRNCFLSTAHTDEHIEYIYNAAVRAINEMLEGGWVSAEQNVQASLLAVPFTEEQEQLYALAVSDPHSSSAFNENQVASLQGTLDIAALQEAVQTVVNRHQALRTVKVNEKGMWIAPKVEASFHLAQGPELAAIAEEGKTVTEWLTEKGQQPFDLQQGPFIRFLLLEEGPQLHQLLMTAHHLVADGWSIELIWSEIGQAYSAITGKEPVSLPAPVPIAAFNHWQEQQQAQHSASREFWQQEFKKDYPAIQLPADHLAAANNGKQGDSFTLTIEPELKKQLQAFAQQEKMTLFNIMLAAYNILLYRLSGQDTFVIGIPSAGQAQMGEACLAGQCVRMLPFYSQVQPDKSIRDYLLEIRTRLSDIIRHQHCSFNALLEADTQLAPPRIATEIDMNSVKNHFRFRDLGVAVSFPPVQYVKYDLSISIIELDEQLYAGFYFNTNLFNRQTVEHWASCYTSLLADMAADPAKAAGELAMNDEESERIFSAWNNL